MVISGLFKGIDDRIQSANRKRLKKRKDKVIRKKEQTTQSALGKNKRGNDLFYSQ